MLALLLALTAHAATVYVPTKDYNWEWGSPPAQFQDFKNGGYRVRAWLESQQAPELESATRALRKETFRYFELENPVTIRSAVLGPPRSTNGHDPSFFVWIEWVSPSKFAFDLDEHRFERKAGVARVTIEGEKERKVEIREWFSENDLRDTDLGKVLPWDAAVVARKMLDLHATRPRVLPENVNEDGKHSPY